jgi:hypothetical protein
MKKHLTLLTLISVFSLSGFGQSQTRTATYLNNLNNFQAVFGDQNFPRARAQDVATDNNTFTCSGKLFGIPDSTSSFRSSSVSSLALQGFGFNIPSNATIDNISITVRRFKKGTIPVGDQIVSLMQRYQCGVGQPCRYGVHWTYLDNYPGKIYPTMETSYTFSQNGRGTNGGFYHTDEYQWTPAIVNHTYFGVRIDNYPPIGKGSVQICYDLVEVTVNFTVPGSPVKMMLNELSVYPNPSTSNTNLRFIAVENGKVVIELYNSTGSKISTIFSGNVIKGQSYNVTAGDSKLPKGTYLYKISNGKQIQTGRIMKL